VSPSARFAASRVEPAQQFQVASQLHRQGRLAEAEHLYGAILEAAPEHFGALYCLATLCARAGRLTEALPLFRRAIDADARSVDAHLNLGGYSSPSIVLPTPSSVTRRPSASNLITLRRA
jgi:tetratricopeptide (TPR) repeat protein